MSTNLRKWQVGITCESAGMVEATSAKEAVREFLNVRGWPGGRYFVREIGEWKEITVWDGDE